MKLAAAQHQAGGLRTAQVFTAAEEGEGGAHLGEAPQILDGRQLGGRVHDDGDAMLVGDGDCLAKGQVIRKVAAAREPEDAGGTVSLMAARRALGRAVDFNMPASPDCSMA